MYGTGLLIQELINQMPALKHIKSITTLRILQKLFLRKASSVDADFPLLNWHTSLRKPSWKFIQGQSVLIRPARRNFVTIIVHKELMLLQKFKLHGVR